MSASAYLAGIQAYLAQVAWVTTVDLVIQQRDAEIGYVRGEVTMQNGYTLHIREYVDCSVDVERLAYAYHYMDGNKQIVFRYDNADHRHAYTVATVPHHKHEGSEENVVASSAPTLEEVLLEIGRRMGT